jgi:monoamine oxidase
MEAVEREGLLTWPEGNAWLTRHLAAPLGQRLHTGIVVVRIAHVTHGVEVDAFNTATQTLERWQAQQAVVALPVLVAARVVENPPEFLRQASRQIVYAPWLVANIHVHSPLHDRPGAAPSWDNVLYDDTNGQGGLGYVDATHQSLKSTPGATVLTHYRALGDFSGDAALGRKWLLERPWAAWRDDILGELSHVHPDLAGKATRMDITRYGHAMAIPVPQTNGQFGLWPPSNMRKQLLKKEQHPLRPVLAWERLTFAHSDWAGYSVFEEAFTAGHSAGKAGGARQGS